VASGHIHHLDASYIRAAHMAADYILELAMGATMENIEHYAMLHRHHLADVAWKTSQKDIGASATISPSWCEGEGCQ